MLSSRTSNPPLASPKLVAVAILLAAASPALATDWPQWRGPDRDSISKETGLLRAWPAGGPALAWKARGIGSGYSGVSVAAGRIYTMGDGADASYLHALDEKSGKVLWSTKVGETGGESSNKYPGTRCTPTVDGARVYTLGQWGELVCAETATGKIVWRRNLAKDFKGRMMSVWGYSESPLIDGEMLLCCPGGTDGTMVALNKLTGAVIWRTKDWTDKASYSSVVVATIGGVRQYVQIADATEGGRGRDAPTLNHVAGVRTTDGKVLWKASRSGRTAVIPTPIVDGNLVYVTSGYGAGCNLFRIDAAGGQFTATEVYANKAMTNHHGGVVKIGENLVGFNDGGGWTWQNFKTGEVAFKAEMTKLGKGSITAADGMLYLRLESRAGTVVLLDGATVGWNEKGRFDPPDRSDKNSWPHPVIANGRLYLRDQDVLLAYDVRKS
ncbi:MAG: PQQ-like beta-propeller repeat protein [Verrucomicrobia bacterium]|nr:PQQ-like beta-propeller repeat protein [Verrucomicrobiota bacterium]